MPIIPGEPTWPYELDVNVEGNHIHFTLDGAWNKKLYQIDPTDNTIPLGIEAEFIFPASQAAYHDGVETINCDQCALTQYAIDHGIDDSYAVGLSIEHMVIAYTPDDDPTHVPPIIYDPHWAIMAAESAIYVLPESIIQNGYYGLEPGTLKMGAQITDNDFTVESSLFHPTNCWGSSKALGSDYTDVDSDPLPELKSALGLQLGLQNFRTASYGNWDIDLDLKWHTELPVFDTDAHLLAYIRSGGRDTTGLLNGEQSAAPDQDLYDYYINDVYTLYKSYGMSYQTAQRRSYRFKIRMKKPGKVIGGLLALVNEAPYTPEDRYPRKYHLIGDDIRSVLIQTNNGYEEYTGEDIKNLKFYRTTAGKNGFDYCKVENWATNIPFKDGPDSEPWARQFLQTGNPQGATNIKKLIPKETPITPGTPVEDTPIPTPGISLARGANIYALTSSQVNVFMGKIFDPASIQDLLNGTQLFGSNQIGAIRDLFYIPCGADDIATSSSTSDIYLGSYKIEMGTSVKWITKNNKLIDCGTVTFNETFGSYLDFEPSCLLYIWLPGCGVHQLQISKYINKTIKLRYAVSVFDGSCMAILSVHNGTKDIVLDTFTGNFAVHIPLTANDQARQTSAVVQGIMQTSTSAIKTIGTVGAGAVGLGAAAAAGSVTAAGAAGIASDLTAGGMSGGGTIMQAANTLQAAMDAPISTRGALSGMLSLFDTMIPTFIAARLNSVEPANELQIVGKPSATGGLVSSFSGFLKTSAFDMSNFPGTVEEANEIQQMFRGGVYVD